MTFFAFFFPISLILVAFKGDDAPKWMSGLGSKVGTNQFKKLIGSIIALAAAVLTYTVIMVIIAKFFSEPGQSSADIMNMITSGEIFADDLSADTLQSMTLIGCIILVYVLNFIYGQIPNVTKMVLDAFGVSEEKQLSEQLANDAMRLTTDVLGVIKQAGKNILNGGEKSDDKSGGGKESKDSKDSKESKDGGKK